MTKQELQDKFNQPDDSQIALIEYRGERGIALMLGETLSREWQSGNILVHWIDGEHTVLPDEFELIADDLWSVEKT